MSLSIITGNIFTSNCQTIVNTVNCVGVMGAGLAFECKLRFPEMFDRYQVLCESGQLDVGKLWLYRGDQRHWILNFPTKRDWKAPSKMEYLVLGLEKFVGTYQRLGISSIAFPLLGADRGGLQPAVVEKLMVEYLQPISNAIDIEIYRYDPKAYDDTFQKFEALCKSKSIDQLAKMSGLSTRRLETIVSAIHSGAYRQLNQLIQVPGIGEKTLEAAFRAVNESNNKQQIEQQSLFD